MLNKSTTRRLLIVLVLMLCALVVLNEIAKPPSEAVKIVNRLNSRRHIADSILPITGYRDPRDLELTTIQRRLPENVVQQLDGMSCAVYWSQDDNRYVPIRKMTIRYVYYHVFQANKAFFWQLQGGQ